MSGANEGTSEVTRRDVLKVLAAAAAPSLGAACAHRPSSAVTGSALFPATGSDLQGEYRGTRYDGERGAVVLSGEPGTYGPQGTYTSTPVDLGQANGASISWCPRWTTPLEWNRANSNPVIEAGAPGTWDAGATVTTCCIVPSNDGLVMFYGARDRGIGRALCKGGDMLRWSRTPFPVLKAGAAGAFDAGGVLSPTVVKASSSSWYMYYVGYDPTRVHGSIKVHQIGLASSDDQGLTWRRLKTGPVLALGPPGSCDGATISSNSVLRVGDEWYCWYTGISQIPYLAGICLATSADGIHWEKYPHNPVLNYNPYIETEAFMVATPHVLREDGVFKMWYNAKGYGRAGGVGDYTIGYAESLDGIYWERCRKQPVFPASGQGWDSQMVEYPEVLNLEGKYYMWYSGDGYGNLGYATGDSVASVSVETRTGASPQADATWSGWRKQDGPAGSIVESAGRYLQIRLSLRTADSRITPMVQKVSLSNISGRRRITSSAPRVAEFP